MSTVAQWSAAEVMCTLYCWHAGVQQLPRFCDCFSCSRLQHKLCRPAGLWELQTRCSQMALQHYSSMLQLHVLSCQ